MPITINVGLSKKIGLANFGSVGASCNVGFEAGHDLLESDLEGFHRKVKNAFVACRQAVQDELVRAQGGQSAGDTGNGAVEHATAEAAHANGNGNGHHQGNGQHRPNGRKATASQVRAIHAIINRQGLDLLETLRGRCGVDYAEDLTLTQASELIDSLKAQANGTGAGR